MLSLDRYDLEIELAIPVAFLPDTGAQHVFFCQVRVNTSSDFCAHYSCKSYVLAGKSDHVVIGHLMLLPCRTV